jgi:hypothetical protein
VRTQATLAEDSPEFLALTPLQQMMARSAPKRAKRRARHLAMFQPRTSPACESKGPDAAPLIAPTSLELLASKIAPALVPPHWKRNFKETPRWSISIKCGLEVL